MADAERDQEAREGRAAPGLSKAPALRAAREAADAKAREESRRLLYVALTRARSRLLVCGAGQADTPAWAERWHGRVEAGLRAAGAEEAATPDCLAGEAGLGPVLRLGDGWRDAMLGPGDASKTAEKVALKPVPVPPAPPPERRLAASGLAPAEAGAKTIATDGGETGGRATGGHDPETARRRGDAVHLLLELLPPIDPAERRLRGAAILASFAGGPGEALHAGCLDEALRALEDPEVAPFLAPEALAEAPVSLALGPRVRISGRIDRLLAGEGRVRVLDWKTGAAPGPGGPAPEGYLRQMAAYREALRRLHPGAEVEAALYWTGPGRLQTLPGADLDAAAARLRADAAP